ncbi:MAG: hypothetical protein WB580_18360, partial [Candidatus Binataceae bacterium]
MPFAGALVVVAGGRRGGCCVLVPTITGLLSSGRIVATVVGGRLLHVSRRLLRRIGVVPRLTVI